MGIATPSLRGQVASRVLSAPQVYADLHFFERDVNWLIQGRDFRTSGEEDCRQGMPCGHHDAFALESRWNHSNSIREGERLPFDC